MKKKKIKKNREIIDWAQIIDSGTKSNKTVYAGGRIDNGTRMFFKITSLWIREDPKKHSGHKSSKKTSERLTYVQFTSRVWGKTSKA